MPLTPYLQRIRNIAQGYIAGAINRGFGMQESLSALADEGLGYPANYFAKDWHEWSERLEEGAKMKYTPNQATLGEDRYIQTGWDLKHKYQTRVRLDLRDIETGQTKSRYVTVGHTHTEAGRVVDDQAQVKTAGAIKRTAIQNARDKNYNPGYEITGAVPDQGWISG